MRRFLLLLAIFWGFPSFSAKVLYLRFQESKGATTFRDSSGNGNNGTCSGGSCPTIKNRGKFLSYASFDGSSDYLSVTDDNSLDFGSTDNISFSSWIRVESLPHFQLILTKGRTSGTQRSNYSFRVGDGAGLEQRFVFYYRNSSDNAWHIYHTSTNVVSTGKWYHLAATYTFGTGASATLYVNGAQIAGTWQSGDGNEAPYQSTEPLHIGAINDTGGFASYFDGQIRETTLWNNILSREKVAQLYWNQSIQYAGHPIGGTHPFATRWASLGSFVDSLVMGLHVLPHVLKLS